MTQWAANVVSVAAFECEQNEQKDVGLPKMWIV